VTVVYYQPFREKLRKMAREIVLAGAVASAVIFFSVNNANTDLGWIAASIFTGLCIAFPLWLVYRFCRFVIGR
jgi:hypothetical protein